MSALIGAYDWQQHSMGCPTFWPSQLRSAINITLSAQAQMAVFWGSEFITFYNDAYATTLGNKHPAALGGRAADIWAELWDDLAPLLMGVWTTGQPFSAKNRLFQIDRYGLIEDVYFDVSYSALQGDDDGAIGGVVCVVSETTDRVLAIQALMASEARLKFEQSFTQLLLDGSSEGIYAVDQAGVTTLCNATALRLLGYTETAEMVGRQLHDTIHHSHADGAPYALDDCPISMAARMGTAAAVSGDVFFKKDGTPLPVDYRAEPVWRDGALQGALCIFVDTTARVEAAVLADDKDRAELALAESGQQLRLAQVAGGVGPFLLDIASDTITACDEFFRLFGLKSVDALPAHVIDALFVDPVQQEVSDRSGQSSRAGRQLGNIPSSVEYRIRKADTGDIRWIARRAEFVLDAAGRPQLMRGVVQDITERKVAEASLKASEARFRVLAQALPNQIWMADAEGQLTWFNQVVRDYCGLPDSVLTGEQWTAQIHPDDVARVLQTWAHCIANRADYVSEMRVLGHSGMYRWFLSRAMPVQAEDSTYWLGANTDIDEQKRLEAGLFSHNAQLEIQVDERTRDRDRMWRLSTDLILVVSTDREVRAVNPAWTSLLGWTEAELLGSDCVALVHPDDVASTLLELANLASGQTTRSFENRYRRRDGGYSSISWTAVPEERLIHAVGRDVTAERDREIALQQVEERLRQSQKMEALGQLTGGIAHDFNNLLQGISGSIEIVRSRLAEGRQDDIGRFMDAATQSAHRAASLIHRLLAFARRQSLDNRPVDVSKLVLSMEDLLRRTLGEQISLKVTTSAMVWRARSDENQLESAILNLAINARDAMAHGGSLRIETLNATLDEHYVREHEGLMAGDYAVVSVTDTGLGMTSAVLARVFEPFFTTKPIGQGTGLGLSGIYGFAKQSGGHVRIHSQLGQGTTVRLYLPRDEAVLQSAPMEPAAEVPQGDGQTVLVVEDDPAVRMVVLDELSELGYRTIEAVDGPSALPILQSGLAIDLLLTDVGLPGMNGRQVAEIARQHRPALRVLFMTGYAQQASSRASFLAPGMEIITKHFTMDDLAARISSIFTQEKACQVPENAERAG